jgi:predicted nucleotide-binding protein (sugar kinase/HSP70/actin superfamily)
MRIGITDELMAFPFMEWLKAELSAQHELEWLHKPKTQSTSIMLSEGDACQPFKSMVRNSIALLPDVDVLLSPRLVNLDGCLMCPNFRALPDIIKLNIKAVCPEYLSKLNDITVETNNDSDHKEIIMELGKQVFNTNIDSANINPMQHRPSILGTPVTPFPAKTIALLGHPYLLENKKLNMSVIGQLNNLGYTVTTPKEIPFTDLDNLAKKGDYYAKTNYWRSSRETLGAFHYYTAINKPDGIIYLISFNCGVDALMRIELMSLQQKLTQPMPFMVLVGDEHTQQEHTATRLEAYLDIIDGM